MPRPDRDELSAINEAVEQATFAHWHSRNLLMLEAVISAMLDVNDPEGVAAILRDHADQLEAYG